MSRINLLNHTQLTEIKKKLTIELALELYFKIFFNLPIFSHFFLARCVERIK